MHPAPTSDKNKNPVIVIYTPTCFLGYGDILFSIKVAEIIKKLLLELNSPITLLYVSGKSFENNALAVYLKEYNINYVSIHYYYTLLREKLINVIYYIHGPINRNFLVTQTNTRIILLSEYGDLEYLQPLETIKALNNRLQQRRVTLFPTGFPFGQHPEIYFNGIFMTTSLMLTPEQQKYNRKNWQCLEQILEQHLVHKTSYDYYNDTSLFFEYSHCSGNSDLYYRSNSHLHFLRVIYESTHLTKNQDIISLGNKIQYKKIALEAMLPLLIKQGFSKISFIDLNKQETHVLYDNSQAGRKYRLISIDKVSHTQFLTLLSVSEELVGITGDQSFSEAISAQKLIVYECLEWKRDHIEGYWNTLFKLTEDQKVRELATLLVTSKTEKDYLRLKELLHDKNITEKLQHSSQLIYKQYNLNAAIYSFLKGELSLLKVRRIEDYFYQFTIWISLQLKRIRLVFAKK